MRKHHLQPLPLSRTMECIFAAQQVISLHCGTSQVCILPHQRPAYYGTLQYLVYACSVLQEFLS
jgi:hypothetical protein